MYITQILYSIAWVRYILSGKEPITPTPDASRGNVCYTSGCNETGRRILEDMDPTADPCQDFYRFACGGFLDKTTIRPDQTTVSAFSKVGDLLTQQLRSIFSETPTPGEPRPHRSMRRLYALCMDEESLEARGTAPVVRLLTRAGGWPVLTRRWEEAGWSMQDTEISLRTLGLGGGSLFVVDIDKDIMNNSRRIIIVDQGSMALQSELLLQGPQHPIVQAYYRYMVDMAVLMGAERDVASQDMWDCLLFQVDLAKIMTPQEVRADFNRMNVHFTLGSLKREVPWIDWYKLIRAVIPARVDLAPNAEPVLVLEVGYLHKLKQLLDKYPKRVIANYMMWDVVKSISNRLTSAIRQRTQDLMQTLTGSQAEPPRWTSCIKVASSFSLVISSLYVERFFNKDGKKAAIEIVETIRQEMSKNIDSLDWMEPHTKLKAKNKVEQILEFVAYPDEILKIENLEKVYEKLEMNQTHYFEALLDLGRWTEDFRLGQLHEPVDRGDWRAHGSITDVNAQYDALSNAMKFPAGILQSPFFSADVPRYVNYATIGLIVGHEIIHGFDNKGSQFDGDGNIHNWWDETSKRRYEKKSECIVNQYSNFRDNQTQLNVNGNLTLGENLADNGGFKLAYNSWLRATGSREPGLPGLEHFTTQQLFMISTANLWCNKYRDQALRLLIMTDAHAPPQVRVNGIMQNMPVFSETFRCAKGRPMNPEQKCTVW